MKLKISFEIEKFPKEDQKEYLVAYLEGRLKIFIDDNLFFCESGILLAELAIEMKKWLQKVELGVVESFVYDSMEYDEPIFEIIYLGAGLFSIRSVWQKIVFSGQIKMREVIRSIRDYVKNFEKFLSKK